MNKIFKKRFDEMPNEEAKRLVKRLNQRIVAIGKTFGKDSDVYNNMIGVLKNDRYANYISESASGYTKIEQSNLRINMQNDDFRQLLSSAERAVPTITGLKEKARERLEEQGKKPTNEDLLDEIEKGAKYRDDVEEAIKFIYKIYDNADARQEFPEIFEKDRVPTYDELDKIISRMKKEKKEYLSKNKEEKGLI